MINYIYENLHLSQIAASNYHYIRYSLRYFIRSMEKLNVHLIELYAAYPHLSILDTSDHEVAMIHKQFSDYGIKICCLTQEQCIYPINIACENERVRERSVKSFYRSIEIAEVIKSPYVLVTAGRGLFDESVYDARIRSEESLYKIAEKAKKHNVILLLEAVSRNSSNVVFDTLSCKNMIDTLNHPNLSGMVDICVINRENEQLQLCFDLLGEHLRHVHLSDFSLSGRVVPGEGTLPIDNYLMTIDKMKYPGTIAFEVINREYEFNPHFYMEKCINYMKTRIL